MTFFLARLHPQSGHLTYVNAGHNPPIVIGTAGLRRLSTGGTIVGAFPESVYEQETVALDPGDILVIFSDGVTEAFNEQWEEFGDDRLVACVTANCERLSEEMLGRIVDTVKAFTGNAAASDDMTVLVLRRSGRN